MTNPMTPTIKGEGEDKNMAKLIIHNFSILAVPSGGGFSDAMRVLSDKENLKSTMQQAQKNARQQVDAIKNAYDNPYGDDDEAIAAAILKKITEKQSL